MPDMERLMREIQIALMPDDNSRESMRAFHRGQDHARRQIAVIFSIFCLIALIIYSIYVFNEENFNLHNVDMQRPNPQDHPGPSGPRVHPVVGQTEPEPRL